MEGSKYSCKSEDYTDNCIFKKKTSNNRNLHLHKLGEKKKQLSLNLEEGRK